MRSHVIAIVHLRNPVSSVAKTALEPMLMLTRGVMVAEVHPSDSLITVEFDSERTGLADIVRMVEDLGISVASVAQRRADFLHVA